MQPRSDERGHFARLWCADELVGLGLADTVAQINTGVSTVAGTLRGMHLQTGADAEAKLVRCVRGSVYDVMVDLRPGSPTLHRWFGIQLDASGNEMLYVPHGCAHGYLTLVDDTELMYITDRPYAPGAATGVRYDDPAFGIDWPAPIRVISQADRSWPAVSGPGA